LRAKLDLENDVLKAIKELARRQHTSTGKVASRLLRQALSGADQESQEEEQKLAGFRPCPGRPGLLTLCGSGTGLWGSASAETVEALRAEWE